MLPSVVAVTAALVAIHVGADVPADLAGAAVRSCETALGERQCVLYDSTAPPVRWQVEVATPSDRKDGARIDLRQNADSALLVTRDLAFVPEDAPRERWASIGVLIAALVVARSREPEVETKPPAKPESKVPPRAPVAAPPPQPPPSVRSRAAVVPPPATGAWRFDVQALLSRRLERGAPELGGRIRISALPRGGPWFGLLSIAGTKRVGTEPSVSWFSASIGPGLRIGPAESSVAAEFGAGGTAEYWSIAASELGRSEQAGEFRWGGFGCAEVLWAVHSAWIFSLGAEGRVVAPRLRVEVSGRRVEQVPELGLLVFAGLRFNP